MDDINLKESCTKCNDFIFCANWACLRYLCPAEGKFKVRHREICVRLMGISTSHKQNKIKKHTKDALTCMFKLTTTGATRLLPANCGPKLRVRRCVINGCSRPELDPDSWTRDTTLCGLAEPFVTDTLTFNDCWVLVWDLMGRNSGTFDDLLVTSRHGALIWRTLVDESVFVVAARIDPFSIRGFVEAFGELEVWSFWRLSVFLCFVTRRSWSKREEQTRCKFNTMTFYNNKGWVSMPSEL